MRNKTMRIAWMALALLAPAPLLACVEGPVQVVESPPVMEPAQPVKAAAETAPEMQACSGHKAGAACHLRGRSLAGGGKGKCMAAAKGAPLLCRLATPAVINHGLPAGQMMAPPELCREGAHPHPWACVVPAPVSDAACADRNSGSRCKADLTVGGVRGLRRGVCRHREEVQFEDVHGWTARLWRPVVVCEPLRPGRVEPAAP